MEAILRNENTGEPDIRKRIRPVRQGARGKGLYQQYLACSLPDAQAIQCYQQALRFQTPEAAPLDYANTQHNLGIAYRDLPTGDLAANLEQAITSYQEALRFLTPEIAPLEYARIQADLGNAYSQLSREDHHTNQTQEIKRSQEAQDLALRSLVTQLPEKVKLNEIFSLLILLSASPTSEIGGALPIALPLGTIVDILVQPRSGLALVGSGEGELVVSSEEETLPLQFKLRGVALGLGQLRVFAFHNGQPLGVLTLTVSILEAIANTEKQHLNQEQSLAPISLHQPDLSLLILEHTEAGMPAFTVRLTAQDPTLGLNLKLFGPIRLKVDALQYFQSFFKDIETLPLKSSREKAMVEQRLAAKGANLFESLFPADLQVLLWSLRSRIQSVQVQSEEPWIPWELCKLCGQDNGRVVEGPFLCEAFALTRWLLGIPMKPSLQLNNMAVVVPNNSALAFASDEQDYLLSLSDGNRHGSLVPAKSLELREALAFGEYDGWHFSGHGGFCGTDPNSSIIYLDNQETFTPEDLSGKANNLGAAKPFVFLNACQIGRSGMSLTDIGGWASQFLRAGAGAFIGSYWSIYDKPALDFAQALYSRLLKGMPIGKAAQEARATIKPAGDPTWLAYTVFADPLAKVR